MSDESLLTLGIDVVCERITTCACGDEKIEGMRTMRSIARTILQQLAGLDEAHLQRVLDALASCPADLDCSCRSRFVATRGLVSAWWHIMNDSDLAKDALETAGKEIP